MNRVIGNLIKQDAIFSATRVYRYSLYREINPDIKRYIAFIGLNPSTADEKKNDPTVTRCMRYAEKWGYGGYFMLNLFAFRATDPDVMKAHQRPVGPDNDFYINTICSNVDAILCAWGNHGAHMNRGQEVERNLISKNRIWLTCLKITKAGHPCHPLYLPSSLTPQPYPF